MLRPVPAGEVFGRETGHQTSKGHLPPEIPPARFYDRPFILRFAPAGHQVHRWSRSTSSDRRRGWRKTSQHHGTFYLPGMEHVAIFVLVIINLYYLVFRRT